MIKVNNGLIFYVNRFLLSGHERSVALKKNIIASFFVKGADLGLGFIRVAILLSFVGNSDYGIWLTVSSFVAWFAFLDIGLGNGLLNKLTAALSKKDYELAKTYLSTAYFSLTLIMGGFYLLFLILFPFINWHSVISPHEIYNPYLNILVLASFTSFALQMVISIIVTVLKADQKYAYGQAIGLVGSIIYLILLIICSKLFKGNLLILSIIAYVPPIICFILFTIVLFKTKYAHIKPSRKYVKISYLKDLAKLGVKFFIIQIGAIVMLTTDNIIISQIGRVSDVVPYNISRYYFNLVSMVYGLILTPLWPAFTDAYVKEDFVWIKRIVKKIIYLWLVLSAAVVVMYFASDIFYKIWVGDKVKVPGILSLIMGLYVIIASWNLPFVFFINGTGKIKLELYNCIVVMIINVPLCVLFAKTFNMGTAGVILSTCLCLFIGSIWGPIQYYKIINRTAKGIWNQ
jgi:O-antigen/teichoic acid export membrane protein